jgi:PAS domain S-box-containing protein
MQNGKFIEVNDAFCRALGKKRQEVIGRTSVELGIWDNSENRKLHLKTLRETGSLREAETEMITRGNQKSTVLWSAEKIKLGGQECLISVITDITQRKKLEAQVRQAQKMEAVGTLAGGIAHDFNNILQAVIGYCQLLQMHDDSPEERGEHVEQIMSASLRAVSLVRRLLAFSRKMDLAFEPLSLNKAVHSVAELLLRTIPKMVEIKVHLATDLYQVMADPVQIEQVLMNLGINASDAMDGAGILTFETKNFSLAEPLPDLEPGQYVVLTVTDTGCGMDSATMNRIFEPFYSTKMPGKGTGLGLSTAYGIVKAHGGRITCYSRLGEGTSFCIYLPAALDLKDIPSMPTVKKNKKLTGTETILLVDDEPDVLKFADSILSQAGYRVLTAENGEEALSLYKEFRNGIALIVLDLDMPEMGGAECAYELALQNKEVKIIVASGHAPEFRNLGPAAEKVRGFLNKPYMAEDLLEKVRSALD